MTQPLLIGLGLLIILISAIALIGALLPRKHTATVTATFNRSAEEVWAAITDFANLASWRRGIKTMKRLEDRAGREVWQELRGKGDSIAYTILDRQAPRLLKSQIVDNKQFGGTWTWSIESIDDSNCTLTITEDGEIDNPIFRIVARLIMGYDATMKGFITDLAAHFGEPR